MRLHKDKETFIELIEATAEYYGINPAIVEKDYYVTLFLSKVKDEIARLCNSISCYNHERIFLKKRNEPCTIQDSLLFLIYAIICSNIKTQCRRRREKMRFEVGIRRFLFWATPILLFAQTVAIIVMSI